MPAILRAYARSYCLTPTSQAVKGRLPTFKNRLADLYDHLSLFVSQNAARLVQLNQAQLYGSASGVRFPHTRLLPSAIPVHQTHFFPQSYGHLKAEGTDATQTIHYPHGIGIALVIVSIGQGALCLRHQQSTKEKICQKIRPET